MEFQFQQNAISQLKNLAKSDCHSVLIYSNSGCGKSFLAREYANYLSISDFIEVGCKVSELKSTISNCLSLSNNIVICIENIDTGAPSSSQVLLKILEEPPKHIYLVITCRNFLNVPDTIISRSRCVELGSPTYEDIETYNKFKDFERYQLYKKYDLLKCLKTLSDVDELNKISKKDIEYIVQCPKLITLKNPISMISWSLQNGTDNQKLPLNIVINYIYSQCNNVDIKRICLKCLDDLYSNKLGTSATLAKFLFEYKMICRQM